MKFKFADVGVSKSEKNEINTSLQSDVSVFSDLEAQKQGM
jgi:magnesium-transporting ATPase (P-type)